MCVETMYLLMWVMACVAATRAIQVQRQVVFFEQTNTVTVNSSVEYVLVFTPMSEQAMWPTRLRLWAAGGSLERPVIVTARQHTGAHTWQLPYATDSSPLFELQRTLCFNLTEIGTPSALPKSGEFSLHISTSSEADIAVQTRADPARDWRLSFTDTFRVQVTPAASAVHFYRWEEDQSSVRVLLESEDDLCALVAVQNYSCPVSETEQQVVADRSGLRMTMQRGGGTFISRARFPLGFFLVAIVLQSDDACKGEPPSEGEDWLWEQVVLHESSTTPRPLIQRRKTFNISFRATLTMGQYWVATTVTLVMFLAFYAAFLALVLAQRIPAFKDTVRPRAVLAKPPDNAATEEGLPDGAHRRWRRDSNATLDSLDDSESDEEPSPPRHPSSPASPASPAAPRALLAPAPVTPPLAFADSAPSIERVQTTGLNDTEAANTTENSRIVTGAGTTAVDGVVNSGAEISDDTRSPVHVDDGVNSVETNRDAVNSIGVNQTGATPGGVSWVGVTAGETNPGVVEGGARAEADPVDAPFGLPARLTLAALSRRGGRTLRARSQRYLQLLYTVAVFYALPVLQFVAAFQIVLYVSGSLDLCYYNFLCAHPAGAVTDFNHVFSNLGYLLLGALFMLQLRRRQARRTAKPKDEEYGIPAHYGLLASLGAGMMVVALLSAAYHICPNRLNFQFDVSFMYVLSVLVMVKLYQARHPDINARAHATFGVLAVLIALVVWGVLGGGAVFWAVFTVLHVFTFLLLSLQIYYLNQFRLEGAALAEAARGLRSLPAAPPLYRTRLVLLAIANTLNWAFALYGLYTMPENFASHLLYVLLGNALLYSAFYLTMKLLHGERLRWYAWCFTAAAIVFWGPALYFFTAGSSSWSSTPAHSRHRNHECWFLQFYDSHDFWHMLSAAALYFTFNSLLTWDDGLSRLKRTEIAVF